MPPKKDDRKRKAVSSGDGRTTKKSKIQLKGRGPKSQCIGRIEVGKGSGEYRQCGRTKYNGGEEYACCDMHKKNVYEPIVTPVKVLEPLVNTPSEIQWIVPQGRTSYNSIYDRYVASLFGYDTYVNTFQNTRLLPSPIQSPACGFRSRHTPAQIKAQSAYAHKLNESSEALRTASNTIIDYLAAGGDDHNNGSRNNFYKMMDELEENEAMLMTVDESLVAAWQQIPLQGQNYPLVALQE
jgi:hypothetical protein